MFIFHWPRWLFVLFILFIAAGCSKKTDTPEAVVNAYYEAVIKSDLRHVLINEERGETGVAGDVSNIFELYDLGGFSSKDLALAKERVTWDAFEDKRMFIKAGGLEKIESLEVDKTGQDEEGSYSRVKIKFLFKNGTTQEELKMAYQRGKEYKLIYPKALIELLNRLSGEH